MTAPTGRQPPTDDALGLPQLDDIEPRPDMPEDPTDGALGLPDAAGVAADPTDDELEDLLRRR